MTKSARQIVDRQRLRFSNNDELKSYYEQKYRTGGYEGAGYVIHGIDISALYHARRFETALRLLSAHGENLVLDAGCGNGALAAQLCQRCRAVEAVDIAANALSPEFANLPNLRFQAMNLETLSYPDQHFDRIVCVETLEHLLAPENALREIARVLKPDGVFVLTYPTINRTAIKQLRLSPRIPVSEHLNEWSFRELVDTLQAVGLQVHEVEGIAFDFGPLLVLKKLGRRFTLALTRCSLAIRSIPSNSMFVALKLRKMETPTR